MCQVSEEERVEERFQTLACCKLSTRVPAGRGRGQRSTSPHTFTFHKKRLTQKYIADLDKKKESEGSFKMTNQAHL